MEFKIRIRNVLLYDDCKKTRLSYELIGSDVFTENEKFKGVADCELYINKNIFTCIDLQDLKDNQVWNLTIKEVANPTNPMKTRRVPTLLENKNVRIDLM